MWEWVITCIGTFVAVFVSLLVIVEVVGRWMRSSASSDRYLSRGWVRELKGD